MDKKDIIISILIILLICSIFAIIHFKTRDIDGGEVVQEKESAQDNQEIERKWLIREEDIPYDLSQADKYEIEQSYISFNSEIRIRRINNGQMYMMTVKSNMSTDGLVRDEVEYFITEESYNNLLLKKEGHTIHKTRYQFKDGNLTRCIDIFKDDLEGLAYLETEFKTEEMANQEESPSWVIKEVTRDKRYKNQSLAQYGIPQED